MNANVHVRDRANEVHTLPLSKPKKMVNATEAAWDMYNTNCERESYLAVGEAGRLAGSVALLWAKVGKMAFGGLVSYSLYLPSNINP